jgi:hypothetical protein
MHDEPMIPKHFLSLTLSQVLSLGNHTEPSQMYGVSVARISQAVTNLAKCLAAANVQQARQILERAEIANAELQDRINLVRSGSKVQPNG